MSLSLKQCAAALLALTWCLLLAGGTSSAPPQAESKQEDPRGQRRAKLTVQWHRTEKYFATGSSNTEETIEERFNATILIDMADKDPWEPLPWSDPDTGGPYYEQFQIYSKTWQGHIGDGLVVSVQGEASYQRQKKVCGADRGHLAAQPPRFWCDTEEAQGRGPALGNPETDSFFFGFRGDEIEEFNLRTHFPVTWKKTRASSQPPETESGRRTQVLLLHTFPKKGHKDWQRQVTKTPAGLKAQATRRRFHKGQQSTLVEEETYHLTFELEAGDYEVVITPPKGLKEWLPQGGRDENTPGDTLTFTGEVRLKKGKAAQQARQVRVTFELTTSKLPGICTNFPIKNPERRADLRILKKGTSPEFKIIEEKPGSPRGEAKFTSTGRFKPGEKFTLAVASFDYGGHGELYVTAEVPLKVEGYGEQTRLKIPYDENDNQIADAWEKKFKGRLPKAPDSDEDGTPAGDGHKGDGLSLFEEYRGFMVKGKGKEKARHVRTDPTRKTLFVCLDSPRFRPGLDLFARASGLEVYEVSREQFDAGRVINPHPTDKSVTLQHILWVKLHGRKGMEDAWGLSYIGPPKHVDRVDIRRDLALGGAPRDLAEVVAHELGHSVRMEHHGDRNYHCDEKAYCRARYRQAWRHLGLPPKEISIAVPQGQNSGDEQCIMRYSWAYYVEYTSTSGSKTFRPYPRPYPRRTQFCKSPKGTGMNAPGRPLSLGDADKDKGRGNCLGQICISDKYHD